MGTGGDLRLGDPLAPTCGYGAGRLRGSERAAYKVLIRRGFRGVLSILRAGAAFSGGGELNSSSGGYCPKPPPGNRKLNTKCSRPRRDLLVFSVQLADRSDWGLPGNDREGV